MAHVFNAMHRVPIGKLGEVIAKKLQIVDNASLWAPR